MQYEFTGAYIIIVAILVLWLGKYVTNRIRALEHYSIPIAVTGGIICSLIVLLLKKTLNINVSFNMEIRDFLLLTFFSTIGISAKFSRLRQGGRSLAVLVFCAIIFLFIQDVTGVGLALLLGEHPGLGLFAGSVSLAGGHGTAIAWGVEATRAGIPNAAEIGIIFATLGLIAGGIIGGPVGEYLIKRYKLQPSETVNQAQASGPAPILSVNKGGSFLERTLDVLFVLAVCIVLGAIINQFLFEKNFKLPGFLTAMFVAILISNFADVVKRPLNQGDFDHVGQLSLQLFLAMSLMSMNLSVLGEGFSKVIFVLSIQLLVITVFTVFIIFRIMGKDYDAAVIASGFCGLGMGATPVAIANMNAVSQKHGYSFKAFLVIPLVGAFFIDIANAVVVKLFLNSPFIAAIAQGL